MSYITPKTVAQAASLEAMDGFAYQRQYQRWYRSKLYRSLDAKQREEYWHKRDKRYVSDTHKLPIQDH